MAEPQKIGKYEIEGVLGKGGMSYVYRGFDRAISRAVAIKAITKSTVESNDLRHIMQRFRHEAQAAGRLVHPHIVQIYDYGEDDTLAYIVMEMVNGKTLAEHLQQEGGYEIAEVGEIIAQLLDALRHAHAANVTHRDIKPANILINIDGRIKIGDFGIARIETSQLTMTGDVIGTPHYMAPEQFLGQEVGAAADLFSVGVIAYELLTGKKPFTGNAATLMQQVLNVTATDASQLNPRLPPLVDRVLHTALAKLPRDRYQSAREFADAFAHAIKTPQNAASDGAPAPAGPLPDGAALLNAARLISSVPLAQTAPSADDPALLTGDSAITLDTGVKRARLLVIDDEERVLAALKSLFRHRYHVFTTTDGAKALEFMRKYQIHVIVSDQRMPVMPGVELLRRSRDISPRSVRILLTGYSDLAAIVGSINDGEIYRFIAKPWDNVDLQTIVAEAATIALHLGETVAAAAPAVLPQKMDAGVLVLARDEEIFRVARELMGELAPVTHAADIDAALAVMRSRETAVVISDLEDGHAQLTTQLRRLKQENPRLLTIVATTASDSELVIELINTAQIFRFLNKPVNVRFLKNHVRAALTHYLTFK